MTMRILVIGAGATGGYFGAAGASGQGCRVPAPAPTGGGGAGQRDPADRPGPRRGRDRAVVAADEIGGPYDLVLLTVKNGALQSAMADMAPPWVRAP
jgi:2-dehydropantoate 2-reductase